MVPSIDSLPELFLGSLPGPEWRRFTTGPLQYLPPANNDVISSQATTPKSALTLTPLTTAGVAGDQQRQNAALALALCEAWLGKWRADHAENLSASLPSQRLPKESAATSAHAHDVSVADSAKAKEEEGSLCGVPYSEPFAVTPEMAAGLAHCYWPGRSHVVSMPERNIEFLLDGAHTPESMEVCVCVCLCSAVHLLLVGVCVFAYVGREVGVGLGWVRGCLLYTSPSPRD